MHTTCWCSWLFKAKISLPAKKSWKQKQESPICLWDVLLCKENPVHTSSIYRGRPSKFLHTNGYGHQEQEAELKLSSKWKKKKTSTSKSKARVEGEESWKILGTALKKPAKQSTRQQRKKRWDKGTAYRVKVTNSNGAVRCSLSGREYTTFPIKEKWKGAFGLVFSFLLFCIKNRWTSLDSYCVLTSNIKIWSLIT